MLSRRRALKVLAAAPLVASSPLAARVPQVARASAAAAARRAQRLAAVRTWGYQLRLLNFQELAAADVDLLVIDHGFSDGLVHLRQFERSEIAHLQSKPDGSRRLVLSYLSIGEAERYRFYFRPEWHQQATRPPWLGPVNPRWDGNYPVDFWDPQWQRLITGGPDSYVSRILAQGFDGLYLDRADVFQERLERHPAGARTMAAFIARIAVELRADDPTRLLIMQNAEELIAERPLRAAIDAIAKEDLYYGVDYTETANKPADAAASERDLKQAQAAGKRIFTVEYVGDAAHQADVRRRCRALGFTPYFAPRLLSRFVDDPRSLAPDYRGALVPQENQDPVVPRVPVQK